MSWLIDILSTLSVAGIWPRFIEPRLVFTTKLTWNVSHKFHHLDKLKIIHISDLHFHAKMSRHFLRKIIRRIDALSPDIIFFTGDFLCYANLEEAEVLKAFLQRLKAKLGCFCSFGNHDYAKYVSRNQNGIYDVMPPPKPLMGLIRGIKTLFSQAEIKEGQTEKVLSISHHEELLALLNETPFTWLENSTICLPIGLNITGIGDLALGRCRPEKAFTGYDASSPGIILSHNPDTLAQLKSYPGDWILSGHTHGEQIHLPWPKWARKASQKLARLENSAYTRGYYQLQGKQIYVTRGLGCHKPFRLFSPPEICLIKVQTEL